MYSCVWKLTFGYRPLSLFTLFFETESLSEPGAPLGHRELRPRGRLLLHVTHSLPDLPGIPGKLEPNFPTPTRMISALRGSL